MVMFYKVIFILELLFVKKRPLMLKSSIHLLLEADIIDYSHSPTVTL